MEKLKSLGVDEIPEEFTPVEFANLSNESLVNLVNLVKFIWSILAMVREVGGASRRRKWWREWRWYDRSQWRMSGKAYFNRIKNCHRNLVNFSFFMKSEELQGDTMKISNLVENKLWKNLKQASIKDYFDWNLYVHSIIRIMLVKSTKNDLRNLFFLSFFPLFVTDLFSQKSNKWNIRSVEPFFFRSREGSTYRAHNVFLKTFQSSICSGFPKPNFYLFWLGPSTNQTVGWMCPLQLNLKSFQYRHYTSP